MNRLPKRRSIREPARTLQQGMTRSTLTLALIVLVALAVAAGWWYRQSRMPSADATRAESGTESGGKAGRPGARGPAARGGGGGGGAGARGGGQAPVVVVAPVTVADVPVRIDALGSVVPRNQVTVRPRVEGQLLRVHFREGQTVKAGELLAEIDPRPFQVQLTQASGQLARDQAQLKNAQLDLGRYRKLLAQDSIARQQVDTQEALVRQYEGAVLADQGQVDNAKLQLSYTRISAPITGRVGLRQVDPGNIVRASDVNGLVTITQMHPITAVFSIPEDRLPEVMLRLAKRDGDTIAVEAWDREQRSRLASGLLLTADNAIDPTTGTVKLKAEFGNEDAALFPSQFVNVRMFVDLRRGARVVPASALQRGSVGTFVYVVKDDMTVAVRPVEIGINDGERAVILSGLVAEEKVVIDGADRLRDGIKVEIGAPEASAAPRLASEPARQPANP